MKPNLIAVAAAAAIAVSCAPAVARDTHARTRLRPDAPASAASRFYPQEIEGGVTGNLPFNNQIRKLNDPLNANGGR